MSLMAPTEIRKCKAIVMFGPHTDTAGMRGGTFFQVTVDPTKVSPSGAYIYFGHTEGDQITGWQAVEHITICEVLGYYGDDGSYPESDRRPEHLEMMVVKG